MAQNADNFKVEILVDGQPLDVHVGRDGQKWVTSSFNAGSTKMIEYAETDPFGERYTQ